MQRLSAENGLSGAVDRWLASHLKAPLLNGLVQKVFLFDRLNQLYMEAASRPGGESFPANVLACLGVRYEAAAQELARIPRTGRAIVVANHPFGLIEGVVLSALLPALRPDVKVMANSLLRAIPELRDLVILVNPYGGENAVRENLKALRDSRDWLEQEGMLVIFPAGDVAHLDPRQGTITDPQWSPVVAKLIRKSNAPVVPVYFEGNNSALFHTLGLLHPRLRTALLMHELFNKHGRTFRVRVGSVVTNQRIRKFDEDQTLMEHVRTRTYLLGQCPRSTPVRPRGDTVPPVDQKLLALDVQKLPAHRKMASGGTLEVWLASAGEVPNVLREIGRLREIAFRAAGEGTGRALDIDRFDAHYQHLFLWNPSTQEIVGAYRLCPVGELSGSTTRRLYTSTLFRYSTKFLRRLGPSIELGRSFVAVEYQKSYEPMLLLWKGIGRFVTQNPAYKVLFGPVSISAEYLQCSREWIVSYLRETARADDRGLLVKPRSPFPCRSHVVGASDLDDLSALIAEIEEDGKGLPVLVRQYLKLGGRILSFNVDARFSNALDGLVVVDLTQTDRRILDRFLGADAAASLLRYHDAAGSAAR